MVRPDHPINAFEDGEPSVKVPTSVGALGDTAPERPKDMPSAIPKRFMSSTWHQNTDMLKLLMKNPFEALLYDLMFKGTAPKHKGKVPVVTALEQHVWVFPRAIPPIFAQYVSMKFGYTWSLPVALAAYTINFIIFAKLLSMRLNELTARFGFLDGEVKRDHTPDLRTTSSAIFVVVALIARPLIAVLMSYNRFELPHFTMFDPFHAFMFLVILDLWFYIYHRAMHESDLLWKFHKTHHMAKHPTTELTGFADVEQDMFDIFWIPLLTCLTYKMQFHVLYITLCYLFHTEVAGHSGLRAYHMTSITSPVLTLFGMDLEIEDHDLHHRLGWRKSYNYGKQTKLWDSIFGTTHPRIECRDENVDWESCGFKGIF